MSIRSMTGFARVHRATSCGELIFTVKSLNHRGLDLHFHLPPDLDPVEPALRAIVKRCVARGHVDVRVSLSRPPSGAASGLNEPLFRAWLGAFQTAARDLGLSSATPDLNAALRIPGMLTQVEDMEPAEDLQREVLAAAEDALAALNVFREREGAELAGLIAKHNACIAQNCAAIEEIRSRATPLFQQRLLERLKELLRGASLEPQRLAQEAALLADRSDIIEEVARLKIHSKQLDEIVKAGGEAGKKMDFLVQEMNRETNTILSKTSGIGELGLRITDLALAAKADIEKIREQALNIE